MSQLTLQSFINTHPSPGNPSQGGNVNLWITTGSAGEFYVNGITIPLVSQESTLATILNQAEKVFFSLNNTNIVRVQGPYIKKTGTVSLTNGSDYVNGTGTAFLTELNTGDGIYIQNNNTLYSGIVSSIIDDELLQLSALSSEDINNSSFYVTGSQPIGSYTVLYSSTFAIENNDVFVTVPDSGIFNGLNEYWFNYDPYTATINSKYSVKISTTGENLEVASGSFTGQLPQLLEFYEAKISNKEKIVSGSLFHYYLILDKPLEINKTIALTSQSLSINSFFFEPSFTSTFKYSEYEVIGNDAQQSRKSNNILKVDRNRSQINPSNISTIVSSSTLSIIQTEKELFANVQDSYYDSLSWTRSRYNGTENNSTKGTTPTAYVATPIEGYVFDSEVSSSQLIESINNGTQLYPSISTVYFYNDSQLSSISTGFTLQPSSSVEATSSSGSLNKLTVTRIDSSGVPTPSTLGGTVTVSFYVTDNWGGFSTVEREITIGAGQSSGYINYNALKITTSNGWVQLTTTVQETFSGITKTTLADTDTSNVAVKITPESRLVGLTKFLEDREDRKELIPLKGKKIYDSKTKALYEVDTNGLLISILL